MTQFYMIFLGALLSISLSCLAETPIRYIDPTPSNHVSTDNAFQDTQRNENSKVTEIQKIEDAKGISAYSDSSKLVSSSAPGSGFASMGGTLTGVREANNEYINIASGMSSFNLAGALTNGATDLFLDSADPNITAETIPETSVKGRDLTKQSASEVFVDATAVANATTKHFSTQKKMNESHQNAKTEFEDQLNKSETDLAMNARQAREFESFARGVQVDSASAFSNYNFYDLVGKHTPDGGFTDAFSGVLQ